MSVWFNQILGLIGISSLIGTVVGHYLNRSWQDKQRVYDAKTKAYSRAFGAIWGLGDNTVAYFLKQNISKNLEPMIVLERRNEVNKELADAALFANEEVRDLLQKVHNLITTGYEVVKECLDAVKKVGDGYVIEPGSEAAEKLAKLDVDMNDYVKKLLKAMQKDLNYKP